MKRVIQAFALFLFVLFFAAGLRPESSVYDIDGFAHLPMMDEGRRKPVDTFARNLLTVLSGKSSVRTEVGKRLSANEWLLDTLAGREAALDYRVIRITQLDLLHQLGLEKRARFRYSYQELMPALPALDKAAQAAGKKDSRDRDLYDREAIKLANRLALFQTSLSAFEDARLIPSDQLFSAIQRTWTWKSVRSHWWFHLCRRSGLATVDELFCGILRYKRWRKRIRLKCIRWHCVGARCWRYALEEPTHFRDALTGYQLTLKREAPELLKYLVRIGV